MKGDKQAAELTVFFTDSFIQSSRNHIFNVAFKERTA